MLAVGQEVLLHKKGGRNAGEMCDHTGAGGGMAEVRLRDAQCYHISAGKQSKSIAIKHGIWGHSRQVTQLSDQICPSMKMRDGGEQITIYGVWDKS